MRDSVITIQGNATANVRELGSKFEEASASVTVAVNSAYFDQETETFVDRKTEFFAVYMSRRLATNALASIHKGDAVVVTGRLSSGEWTDQDGNQRWSMKIQADTIGHDLTYGTTRFHRASKHDTPPIESGSGEFADQSRSGAVDAGRSSSGPFAAGSDPERELTGAGVGGASVGDAPF